MTHSHHSIDPASLAAHAVAKRSSESDARQILELLRGSTIPRTAKELAQITGIPLVTCRSRISDMCTEGTLIKVQRVREEGSAVPVWCFSAAMAAVGP